MVRRVERREPAREWPVEWVADIEDHPFQPLCTAKEGVADVSTLEHVQEELIWVRKACQKRFRNRSAGYGYSFDHGICRPVCPSPRLGGGRAIQVKSDGARIPGEGVIV